MLNHCLYRLFVVLLQCGIYLLNEGRKVITKTKTTKQNGNNIKKHQNWRTNNGV